jgi:hydroxyacylglutathione hydrolase
MLIKTLPVGHLETNCYIVTDENTLDCAIIDPGDESGTILNYIEDHKLTPRAILITHGHFDHTGGVAWLMREFHGSVKLYVNEKDTEGPLGSSPYGFNPPQGAVHVQEGDVVQVGGLAFRVLDTPGHTPGGVTYLCENAMFPGDTLFRDSCGRTDLPGGDMAVLMHSLKKLHDLPGDYEIYPGHMDTTTLDRERRFNYYMQYSTSE